MLEEEPPKKNSAGERRWATPEVVRLLRWPVVVVVVALVGGAVLSQTCRSVDRQAAAPLEVIDHASAAAITIAERFKTGRITTTFESALPRLLDEGGPRLEVAAFESIETLTRTDERRMLFDLVPLGTTVTEIRVPVTFRYHLSLDEPWVIEVVDQDCRVKAPAPRPTLPPAIHTDRMERHTERGWFRFDAEEQMDELERSLTPTLSVRAAEPETIDLVRDRSRLQVGRFIRSWLVLEEHWRPDRFRSITVVFSDDRPASAGELGPTVVLEQPQEALSPARAR